MNCDVAQIAIKLKAFVEALERIEISQNCQLVIGQFQPSHCTYFSLIKLRLVISVCKFDSALIPLKASTNLIF